VEPAGDWIPLPPGTTLSQLPDRLAQGRLAGRATTLPAAAGWAAAAILPPGYTRTLLPAYEETVGARVLPLYGYSAVAWFGNELRVAGLRTDPYDPWQPRHFNQPDLAERVEDLRARFPRNRVIEQLATCALAYRCFTAQNTFYQRWEGALPSSHGCNAACLGCISEQWGEVAAPQSRVAFRPSAGDLSELALHHLSGKRATMVSFGQGCEGEPLTRGAALVEALRAIRGAAVPRRSAASWTPVWRARGSAPSVSAMTSSPPITAQSVMDSSRCGSACACCGTTGAARASTC
jgi:hypothetical protein